MIPTPMSLHYTPWEIQPNDKIQLKPEGLPDFPMDPINGNPDNMQDVTNIIMDSTNEKEVKTPPIS